ncbi:MAG: protease pro-enzyme activation domain-containing protein [Gammaproteobacteria bacterium]
MTRYTAMSRLVLQIVLLLLGAVCLGYPPHSQAGAAWVPTHTRAHPTRGAKLQSDLAPSATVDIQVALKLRNRTGLDDLVNKLVRAGGHRSGHWLSHAQVQSNYAPTAASAQTVADYLKRATFTNVRIGPNRLFVSATGTAAAVRKAFHTRLAYFSEDGHVGIANVNDVQVPASLGGTVLAVLGLQTMHLMHTMARPAPKVQLTGSKHGLNPTLFPIAYDAAGLPAASAVSVGIITEGDMTQTISDLHQFESVHGLPTINPTVVNVKGSSTDTSNTAEWDIDSQDIQAMAGGQVAQMVFYTARSLSDSNIASAINEAYSSNTTSVVNISLGICESYAQADGSMAADDQVFQMAVAQGQTFAAASGDSGSKECGNPTGTAAGASYPASSPYVIAVGGTTLYTDSGGNYGGETAWSGGGGSPSLIEPQPSWQNGVVPGGYRGVPDIAFDADPYSGAIVIVNGKSQQYGGTSLAAPLFVGAWARIQTANNAKLGFPATWMYSRGAQGTSAFRDVTSGSNGDYSATTGWDYTTGFGSFDIAATAQLTVSTVNVSVSPSMIVPGDSVTLTATVSGNSPTGTVQFQVNGVDFGSPVQVVNGVATLTTTQLTSTGRLSITAVYSGDLDNAGGTSSASATLTVTPTHTGDINGDGTVNAADVMLAQQFSLGLKTPTADQLARGDVAPLINGAPAPDGKIDGGDVLVIEQKALGLLNF